MVREHLRDDQWECIKNLLPGKTGDRGVTAKDNRKFVEAVLWIARTGSPWRDLSVQFGHWNRMYVRTAGATRVTGCGYSRRYRATRTSNI